MIKDLFGDNMHKLGCFLLLCSSTVLAQDVVVNPPINLEPVAVREIKQVDSQINLNNQKLNENLDKKLEIKEAQYAPKSPEVIQLSSPIKNNPLQQYLQFSFGYLNSQWRSINSSLDNGSTLTDFRIVSDMNGHNQLGMAIEFIQDTSSATIPENIRALQYKIFLDYHRSLFVEKLDLVAGLALSVGDFSIRKLSVNGSGQEVYTKLHYGTLYGIIPSLGFRFYFIGSSFIDLTAEYHEYLSRPQRYIGGFAFVPRFSVAY